MKVLIAFINWGIVAVMAVGGIVFLAEALRKNSYLPVSERLTFGAIGISCILIGALFFFWIMLS